MADIDSDSDYLELLKDERVRRRELEDENRRLRETAGRCPRDAHGTCGSRGNGHPGCVDHGRRLRQLRHTLEAVKQAIDVALAASDADPA